MATIDLETLFDDSGTGGGRRRLVLSPGDSASRFDQPGARAIGVADQEHLSEKLFGLACDPRMPVRIDAARKVCGRTMANTIKLVGVGRAPLPPDGAKQMILVYKMPAGLRLAAGAGASPPKMDSRDILTNVVAPIAEAISSWQTVGFSHGAIRPDNLYYADSSRTRVELGEALSAPCGRWQPGALEPVERSMAVPAGRGEGGPEDDVYALGATVAALLKGSLPDADENALIRWRLAEGSAVTITDFVDAQSALGIALHGMLADDPNERWTADEILRWVADRVRPRDVNRSRRQRQRSYVFLGVEYRTPKALANALASSPNAAGPLLHEGKVADWLLHSFDNSKLADSLSAILSPDHPNLRGRIIDNDELAARAAILLDPLRPVTYRGTSVFPGGIGGAMADAKASGDSATLGNLVEILRLGLAEFWFDQQAEANPKHATIQKLCKSGKMIVNRDQSGFTAERILYELNPSLACQAKIVAGQLILDIEELLPALDEIAKDGPQKGAVIDAHLAGFITSRLNITVGSDYTDVLGGESASENVWRDTLRLLAQVQDDTEASAAPHLAAWLSRRLMPVIEKLHNRSVRNSVETEMRQIVENGDLVRMAAIALNSRTWRQDNDGFTSAKKQVAAVRRKIRQLTEDPTHRAKTVDHLGYQLATAAAYTLLGGTLILVAGSVLI